jgi:hypothetical protein
MISDVLVRQAEAVLAARGNRIVIRHRIGGECGGLPADAAACFTLHPSTQTHPELGRLASGPGGMLCIAPLDTDKHPARPPKHILLKAYRPTRNDQGDITIAISRIPKPTSPAFPVFSSEPVDPVGEVK